MYVHGEAEKSSPYIINYLRNFIFIPADRKYVSLELLVENAGICPTCQTSDIPTTSRMFQTS